jgi:hypothetical protein
VRHVSDEGAVARHTKGDQTGVKAARPNIRVLKRNQFRVLKDIEDVAQVLFGLVADVGISGHCH